METFTPQAAAARKHSFNFHFHFHITLSLFRRHLHHGQLLPGSTESEEEASSRPAKVFTSNYYHIHIHISIFIFMFLSVLKVKLTPSCAKKCYFSPSDTFLQTPFICLDCRGRCSNRCLLCLHLVNLRPCHT